MEQDLKYWLFYLLIPFVVYLSFYNNGKYNKSQKEELELLEKRDSIVKCTIEEIGNISFCISEKSDCLLHQIDSINTSILRGFEDVNRHAKRQEHWNRQVFNNLNKE